MIDLTNENHKRGVMILTSKDVRTVDNNLFDWRVHTDCVRSYIEIIERYIKVDPGMDDRNVNFCLDHIKSIKKWLDDSQKNIDKARDVFR